MTSLLAWTPFLQPAPGAQHWWWLLVIPMALGVSMAYKAIRVQKLGDWPKAVVTMAAQIVAAMIAIAIGLYLLVIVLLPVLPAD
jgi:ABC-type proline/glycine betaine transport system permease subunit